MLRLTRTYVVRTPKSCQDRKVAAVRDAFDRRRLRVTFFGKSRRDRSECGQSHFPERLQRPHLLK